MAPPLVPPHDYDAERAVLGAALLEAEAAELVAQCNPSIFYPEKHGLIATAIGKLVRGGDPVDVVTVQAELKAAGHFDVVGGAVMLAGLIEAGSTAAHVGSYLDIVRDHATRRELMGLGLEMRKAAAQNDSRPADLIAEAMQRLLALDAAKDENDILTPEQFAADLAMTPDEAGLTTGLDPIDEWCDGLRPGNLLVIAGRPGMGKTALAVQVAHRVSVGEGRPILFLTLEMFKREIGKRLLGLLTGQNARRTPPEALPDGLRQIQKSGFHIWDEAAPTVGAVTAKTRRAVARHRVQAVFVDHLGKIRGSRRENRYLEMSEVAQALKAIAKQLSIPVLALCQLNRLVERRNSPRPQLSDLRDSGAIEEEADAVIFAYTTEERPEGKDPLPVKLYLAKNRHGETGERAYYFQKSRGRFVEAAARQETELDG